MPFLINEDRALKTLLSGLTVSDAKNSDRPVGVWFGQPDVEIRQQSYPYLTIDMIDVSEANERSHRGWIDLPYTPEGGDPDVKYSTEFPIPVNIDYQVTSYARQPIHDRQIVAAILSEKLPLRFGMLEVPEDNTARRIDFLGYVKRDTTEADKRLFVNVFTIRVSAEILPGNLMQLYKADTVNISLTNTNIDLTQDSAQIVIQAPPTQP